MLYYNKYKKLLSYDYEIGIKKERTTLKYAQYYPPLYVPITVNHVYSEITFLKAEIPETEENFDYYTWFKFGVALFSIEILNRKRQGKQSGMKAKISRLPVKLNPLVARAMEELTFYSVPSTSNYRLYRDTLMNTSFYKKYVKECLEHHIIVPSIAFQSKQRLTAVLEGIFALGIGDSGYHSYSLPILFNLTSILRSVYNITTYLQPGKPVHNTRYYGLFLHPEQNQIKLLHYTLGRLPVYVKPNPITVYKFRHLVLTDFIEFKYEIPVGWDSIYTPDVENSKVYTY